MFNICHHKLFLEDSHTHTLFLEKFSKYWVFKNVGSTVTQPHNKQDIEDMASIYPDTSLKKKKTKAGVLEPRLWNDVVTSFSVNAPVELVRPVWDRTEWHSGKDHSDSVQSRIKACAVNISETQTPRKSND